MTITYNKDGTKTVSYTKRSRYVTLDNKPYHERMLRNYYDLECSGTFTSTMPKSKIKQIWERDGQRREAGIGD